MKLFNFENLFVLDMANNHQGELSHGKDIINEMSNVVKKHDVKSAIKFQFRQLQSFIHPEHQLKSDHKHITRFKDTKLDIQQYNNLFNEVKKNNLLTMCTPFDEASVDEIVKMNFDIIKVASCSATDWPLLEKIAEANLPVIFSTGGLQISDIDNLVSFFDHRDCDFAMMHCVSLYPIPDEDFYLNQIDILKNRYPKKIIGWSTHEDPDDTIPISIAIGKGAKMFERHVGKITKEIKLNSYSSTAEQTEKWIMAAKKAWTMCGGNTRKVNSTELDSINSLRRGVFAKRDLKSGSNINFDDIYFAMPFTEGQLSSGDFKEGIKLKKDVSLNQSLNLKDIIIPDEEDFLLIKKSIHEVKAMLSEARIILNSEFEVEYSHHYGVKNFRKTGVIIINVINREYCKKILVQLPGQMHPSHHHKLKEETFQVLSGSLNVWIDGREKVLCPGDVCLVLPGVWHSFSTKTGCIFEEVSTTHYDNDSVYRDKSINDLKREERKTKVNHWGRYELPNKIFID